MKIAPSGSKQPSKKEPRLAPGVDPPYVTNTASAETNETRKQKRSHPNISQASSNTRSRPCDAKQSELVSSRIEPLTPGAFRVTNTSPDDTNETRKHQRRSDPSVSQTPVNHRSRPSDVKQLELSAPSPIEPLTPGAVHATNTSSLNETRKKRRSDPSVSQTSVNNRSRPSDVKQLEPESSRIEPLMSGVLRVSHDVQAISEIDAVCHPSLVAVVVDEDEEEQLRNRVTELEHRLRKQSELPSTHLNDELCYDAVGFVGRKEETELLWSRLDRLRTSEGSSPRSKELVLISGYSGVGKSQLANTLVEQIHSDGDDDSLGNGGMFARGKYDLNQRDQPCFGIAQALNDIFDRMSSGRHGVMDIIGPSIASELGSEVQLLKQLIPNLHAVLPSNTDQQDTDDDLSSVGYESGQARWKHIFRSLIRILSSHVSPLVLVLDDLQWADNLSLNIVEYLMTDTQNSNGFMIAGCFRSNEVDESHPLSKQIHNLQQKSEKSDFHFTKIEVTNLQKGATNQVIMALLTIPNTEQTKELADICHNRTLGNPFFLIEFVTMLKRDDLIRFNVDSVKWEWDIQAIQEATVSADNVVDLLQRRMVQLPGESQLLLQYAACLGASFGTAMMDIVWAEHSSTTTVGDTNLRPRLYEALVQEHFIESRGGKIFAWVHDKVQEAALSLRDAASRSFQFEIGMILAKNLTGQELDESIFIIVDLLNKGNEEPLAAFAELNLRAARRAKNLSAFDSAAAYVSHGIGMLPEDSWESHRELTLSLYCLGVEAELAAGHFSEMDKHSEAVLSQKDCTLLEKLPVIYAQSYRKCKLLVSQEAIDYTLKALKDLGCNIVPVSAFLPIYAIRSFRRAVRKGRTATRDFYKDLPIFVDKKENFIMGMIINLGYAAYLSKNNLLFGLCTSKAVERTLKYGASKESGAAFASFAITIQAISGNTDDSIYFAEMGLLLQDRAGTKYNRAQCLNLACAFSLSFARPLESLLPSLLDGYQIGMQSGSVIFAMWNLFHHHIAVPYQLGTPLASIESELSNIIALMEEMGEDTQSLVARLWGQTILDLVGVDNKNQILRGDLFNCEGWVPPSDMMKNSLYFMRLQLSVIFADYDKALEVAVQIGDTFRRTHIGLFECQEETFFRGLTFYRSARQQTRSAKYMKAGKKLFKRLEDWAKNGNPNVLHYIHLLKAEQASLNKKHNMAESFYHNSIDEAVRLSNWKHAALSCECYAHFLRDVTHKEDEFVNQLKEASKYYREWGANAKVRMLEDKLRRYL